MSVSSPNNAQTGNTRKGAILHPFEKTEARFRDIMQSPLKEAEQIGEADIVVGIPFFNETDSITHVVEIAKEGLNKYYPGFKCVIVAAGSPVGKEALEAIDALPQDKKIKRITFLLDDEHINGKGWSVRAIGEIAQTLGADQVILEADLKSRKKNGEIEGLAPDWIYLLLEPIRTGQADMVISRFNRHFLEAPISTYTMYPLFSAIYNCPIQRLVGGQWGISHHILRNYLKDARRMWATDISGYGIDSWIATSAIVSGAKICEANLGIKIHNLSKVS